MLSPWAHCLLGTLSWSTLPQGHHVHNFHPLGVSDTMLFQETATERAIKSFKLLDVNGDGELNEDEFVEGCMRDKTLSDLLNAGNLSGP